MLTRVPEAKVEVPMVSPMFVPPFGVRAERSVVVAHFEVEPLPDPQAAPAAEMTPVALAWRHLVAPVPVLEMTRAEVEAVLMTVRVVAVA